MPRIRAIPAICYATKGDVSPQISPPYDVLDEGPKKDLLARCEHNIVAIDLPVTPPKTVGPDSAYQEAGQTLEKWIEQGVLAGVQQPCIFAYEQVYKVAGQTLRRRGVFVDVDVEPFNQDGGVFRHERTIRGGIDDRSKLMAATAAQLSPVFGIFNDPQGEVAGRLGDVFDKVDPDYHGTTEHDGVVHRCWQVTDEPTIAALRTFFDGRNVFIADGHHRYTTALNHHEAHPQQSNGRTCLFVLVAAENPGMIVLPTHRIICGLRDFSMEQLLGVVQQRNDIALIQTAHGGGLAPLADGLAEAGHHAMGVYDPATQLTYVLEAPEADPLAAVQGDKAEVWRNLDVAILHELLIDRVLRPNFGGDEISFKYTAEVDQVREMAGAEPGRLGILLQATPLASVCEVSLAGEVMPPKSTFFYPKVATGLVINPLDVPAAD